MNHSDLNKVLDILQRSHSTNNRPAFYQRLSFVDKVFYDVQSFASFYKIRHFDFIHDRKSGLFLVDVNGPHHLLMADLFQFYTGSKEESYKASDAYIDGGWGMFRSRAGHKIMKAEDWELDEEFNFLMRDLERD